MYNYTTKTRKENGVSASFSGLKCGTQDTANIVKRGV
jgi:hypothetical protein